MQVPKHRRSIQNIANQLQWIRKVYSSQDSERVVREEHRAIGVQSASLGRKVLDVEEEADRSKKFLDCVLEGQKKPSDYDDLASFIEYLSASKLGKDHNVWLKYREKYRSRQVESVEKRAGLWRKGKGMQNLQWRRKLSNVTFQPYVVCNDVLTLGTGD